MVRVVLTLAALISGLAYLAALVRRSLPARYTFKPATMLFIILLAATGLPQVGAYGRFIVLGLAASTIGDVLLLPPDRLAAGMGAFLLAHLLYLAALLAGGAAPLAHPIVVGAPLVLAIPYLYRLRPAIRRVGGTGLEKGVFAYMAVLSIMTGTALTSGRPLAAAGGLLFYLSDGLITWRRFVRYHRALDYAVIITYYAAQYCLALSVLAG